MEGFYRRYRVVTPKDKLTMLPDYCLSAISLWIKSLDEYRTEDYEGVVEQLKERYAEHDKIQKIFTIHWLEAHKNVKRDESADLVEYITNYHNVSEELVRRGLLATYFQGMWFIQGLPEKTQEVVVRKAGLKVNKPSTSDYRKVKKVAEGIVATAQTLKHLRQKEYRGDESGEMLKEFEGMKDQRSTTMVQPDGKYPEPDEHTPETNPREPPRQTGAQHSRDPQMDTLAEELRQLRVSNMQLQQQVGSITRSTHPAAPQGNQVSTMNSGQAQYNAAPANQSDRISVVPDQCAFCFEHGHFIGTCQHAILAFTEGMIYRDETDRIKWNTISNRGQPMRFKEAGRSRKEQVETVRQMRPATNNNTTPQVNHFQLNNEEEDTDEELAVDDYLVQSLEPSGVTEDPEVLAMKRRREELEAQEENGARIRPLKTERAGTYVFSNNRKEGIQRGNPGKLQKGETTDEPQGAPPAEPMLVDQPETAATRQTTRAPGKPALRKDQVVKKEKLANQIKNTVNIGAVLERILDMEVPVPVRDLIGGMPELHKRIFQSQEVSNAKENRVPEVDPQVNSFIYETNEMRRGEGVIDKIRRGESLYAVGTIHVAVRLGIREELYSVMMDSGAEINLMYAPLAAQLGLTVTCLNRGQLASANKSKTKFKGIAEKNPVSVGGLKYLVPFFIVDEPISHDCILGRPFEMQALVGYQNESNGSVTITFKSADRRDVATTTGFAASNKRNKSREEVFEDEHRGDHNPEEDN